MALTIDATVAGANSNSYVTEAEAEAYFESRANSEAWNEITDVEVKKQLLITSTRTIDYNDFLGQRKDITTPQALKFPRVGLPKQDGISVDDIIPNDVKMATYELAIHLINTDMSTFGTQGSTVKKEKVSSLEVEYAVSSSFTSPQNSELPPFVSDLLDNYSNTISDGAFIYMSR